jgi:hypothetical protein
VKNKTPNAAYLLLTYSLPLFVTLMGLMGLMLYHFNYMQSRVLDTYQKIKSIQAVHQQNEQIPQFEAEMAELLQDRNGIMALMIALSFGFLATMIHRAFLHVKQVEMQLALSQRPDDPKV